VGIGLAAQPVRFLFTLEGVLIGMTQVLLPFMVVPLIATLQTLPSELDDAAANLGATKWRTFWAITVPQSVPGIAAGVSLVFILAYTEFTVSILMGGATFNVVSVYIFQTMTTLLDWARGAAMASVLLVSCLAIITIFNVAIQRLAPWAFLKA
jgi:putative spermidine/putrescine transport system permease protein